MRKPADPFQSVRPAFQAVWLAMLGLLLAFQATSAIPAAPSFAAGEVSVAKVTAAAPLIAQFREAGQTVHVVRAATFKLHDGSDGGYPPLPGRGAAFARPAPTARPDHDRIIDRLAASDVASAYRARAPPVIHSAA